MSKEGKFIPMDVEHMQLRQRVNQTIVQVKHLSNFKPGQNKIQCLKENL